MGLSVSAVATLAHCLHRVGLERLADVVGVAVDANRDALLLTASEEEEILRALYDCPVVLQPLRDALRAKVREPAAGLR